MSKKTLSVGLIILGATALAVWFFFMRDWPVKNYPSTKSGPIVIFGDSLAEGVGATAGNELGSQLGQLTGTAVINYGVSGDTTRDALVRLPDAVAEEPKIAIVLLGGNDFLRKIPREETFQNLEKIITAFQNTGAVVIVLGVRSGIIGGGADDEYEALAKRTGAAYVNDVLSGIFGTEEFMSDAIHPNDKGYTRIAERVAPVLQKLLR